MALIFRYKSITRPDGSTCYGPWILATIKGPKATIDVVFLLDSGADCSVIPQDLAELLGLDLKKPIEPTKGVGGEVNTKTTEFILNLGNPHERYTFKIPVNVILQKKCEVPPLLGRDSFFNKFQITFNERDGKVTLKRAGRKKNY